MRPRATQTNTCEGTGAVTTGNSALPDAWQTVVGTVEYSGDHPAHGSAGLHFTTTTTSKSYVEWATDGSGQQYARFNCYLETAPTSNHRLVQFRNAQGSCLDLELRTDPTIRVRDAYGRQQHQTQPLDIGHIYRVEVYGRFLEGNGESQLWIYDQADSMTTVDTFDSQADETLRGSPTFVRFGAIDDVSTASLWMDDIGLSPTGFLGPVSPLPVSPAVEGVYAVGHYGDAITLTLLATSTSGPLVYAWSVVDEPSADLDSNGLFVTGSGSSATVTALYDGVGVVRCVVADQQGLATTADSIVEFINDMTTGTGPGVVAMPVVSGGFGLAPFGSAPFGA